MTPAITVLTTGLKIAKLAMIGLNFAMSANPVGAIVIGVTALVAAGIALYENWSKVKDLFSSIGDVFSGLGFGDGGVNVNNTATQTIAPAVAQQSIQQNSSTNVPVAISVNIADGQVKGVETSGATKTDVFLNNGVQQ